RVTAFYAGCQSIPLSLLVIHFLYRYWSVCRPEMIELFSNKLFGLFFAAIIAAGVIVWHIMCLVCSEGHDVAIARQILVFEYTSKYGKHIEGAWVIFDHWRDDQFDFILFVVTLLMDIITVFSLFLLTGSPSSPSIILRHPTK
ncbi:hypothetical protein PENTCL1PPCAC_3875, partial [Pristionchus entomophagus]